MKIADLFARLTLQPDKKSFDAADKLLGGVKKALLGLAVFKAGEVFYNLIEDTVKMGAAAVDTSKKIGISAQEVESLSYAAKQSGADVESVVTGYAHMAKGLLEAKQKGTGPLVDGLQALGISMSDPAVKSKNLSEIFGVVADKMSTTTDASVKLGAGMMLFGRGGKDLLPLLSRGSEGIAKLRQDAVDLGYAMDDDANESLKSFAMQTEEVKASLIGVRNSGVVAILPYLKEMVDGFAAWVKENRKMLAQRLAAVIHGIAFSLQVIGFALGFVIDFVQLLVKHFGLVIAILSAVGIAFTIYKAAAIRTAIASAIAWAEAALPFILIAALITAVILVLEDLYTWVVGGDSLFKEFYESIKHWVGEGIANIINGVIDDINELIAKLEDLIQRVNKLASGRFGQIIGGITGANVGAIADQLGGEGYKAGRIGHVHEGDWSGDPTDAERSANMQKRGFVIDPHSGQYVQDFYAQPQVSANATITINPPPGSDTKAIAEQTSKYVGDYFSTQFRRVVGGTGGNR